MNEPRVVHDVAHLPTYTFGPRNPLWWGTGAFMVIEGLAFVFAVVAYLYFYNQNDSWPLGPQPGLLWSSLIVLLLVASEIPNHWLKKAAQSHDLRKLRIGLIIMSVIGVAVLALRCFEFTTVNIRWDDNVYGSIIWFLLGLHTLHVVTDVLETLAITVSVHLGPVDMRRFADVQDNQDYWRFVVIWWLVLYVVLYWFPRWFEVLP